MLKYKIGDLIEAAREGEVNVIAHCCNCYCTMGSGIAPLIKRAFPEAYEADLQTCKGDLSKLGQYSVAYSTSYKDVIRIYNLYGQEGYSNRRFGTRDLNYNALYDAFELMATDLAGSHRQVDVGLPLIGCGLAGGSWNVVSAIIEDTLLDFVDNVTIYILNENQLPKGVKCE